MKVLAAGLVAAVAGSLVILSIRPGGLRRQLRNAARRLRLALALGGVYLCVALGVRLAFPDWRFGPWAVAGAAVVLGAVFVVLAADEGAGGRPPA